MDQRTPTVNISHVEIIPFRPSRGFVGFASCILNDLFYIADIALFTRPTGGLRLGYPIKKLTDGSSVEIFRIMDREVERSIEQAVTEAYEQLLNSNGQPKEPHNGTHSRYKPSTPAR